MYDSMAEYYMTNMVAHNNNAVNGSIEGYAEHINVLIKRSKHKAYQRTY